HDGGDPVPARRRHFRIPGRLPVIMGVDVDKARRDNLAAGVDLFATGAQIGAHRGNSVTLDRDIGNEGSGARAIDDRAAANYQIVHPDSPDFWFQEETYHQIPDVQIIAPVPRQIAMMARQAIGSRPSCSARLPSPCFFRPPSRSRPRLRPPPITAPRSPTPRAPLPTASAIHGASPPNYSLSPRWRQVRRSVIS